MSIAQRFVQTFFVALGAIIATVFLGIAGFEASSVGWLFLLVIAGGALRRIDWWCTYSLAGVFPVLIFILVLLGERFRFAPVLIMAVTASAPIIGGMLDHRLTQFLNARRLGRLRVARAEGGGRPRLYCLHCFETLARGTTKCGACGLHSRPSARRIYWNRNRTLQANERLVKALVVVVTIGGYFVMLPMGIGTYQGWFILLPTFLGVGLWMTASKITRHELYFRPGLVWGLSFAIVGVLLLSQLSWWSLLAFAGIGEVYVACRIGETWKERLQAGASVPGGTPRKARALARRRAEQ